MHPLPRRATLGVLLALAAACAGPRTQGAPRASREEISQAAIKDGHYTNAWDAVSALHSNWLQTRGTDSFNVPTQVWVYIDAVRVGGVDALREIPTTNVASIRHLDGVTATARYGVGHSQGVILVSTAAR